VGRSVDAGEDAQDKLIQTNTGDCAELQRDIKRIDATQYTLAVTVDKTLPSLDRRQEKIEQTISDIATAVARIETKLEKLE